MGTNGESAAARNLRLLDAYEVERLGARADLMRSVRATYRRSARDVRFAALLDQCVGTLRPSAVGARGEATGIVLLGETGAGKSRLVKVGVGENGLIKRLIGSGSQCAAVRVRCLGAYTLRVLAMEIIRATGYPIRNLRENVAWIEVRDRLRHLGVMVLCIDEVNNLVGTANRAELKRILNNFKALMNHPDWPVVLVLSGTPGCEGRLRQDEEFSRRVNWMSLDPLGPGDVTTLETHLAEICGKVGLAIPVGLMPELMPRLVHAGRSQFGTSIDIAVRALEVALLDGGPRAISMEHFATAFAWRTQAAADANPFVAANWAATVPMPVSEGGDDENWDMAAAAAAGSRESVGLSRMTDPAPATLAIADRLPEPEDH